MVKVESFELDHTNVVAPFVRKCCTLQGPNGDIVEKFDLRFMQPNIESMPTGAIHTLEHLMAIYFREKIDDIIDLSPMGCRTGFYLTKWGTSSVEEIREVLIYALEKILNTEDIPAANEVQCGNYRDHSLFGAKEYAKYVLKGLKEGKGRI